MNAPCDVSGETIHQDVAAAVQRMSAAVAMLTALAGAMVLLGWFLDIPALKGVLPGLVTMKANTAVCFVLSGASLLLLQPSGRRETRLAGSVLAVVTLTLALLTLSQYLFDVDLGIDQALVTEPVGAIRTVHLGRMSPITAVSFAILGMGLLSLGHTCPHRRHPAEILGAAGLSVALLAVIGYIYGAEGFYNMFPGSTGIALTTAVLLQLAFLGLIFAHPDHWTVKLVTGCNAGGVLARRLLPAAVLAPLGFEIPGALGEMADLMHAENADALHAALVILTLVALVLLTGKLVRRLDNEQARLAAELEAARAGLERTVRERTRELREEIGLRQKAEEELRANQAELEKRVEERTADLTAANEEVRNFAYIVSHDLRAPLINIQGFCGELRHSVQDLRNALTSVADALPEERRRAIMAILDTDLPDSMGFIDGATTKMDRQINAILKLSRLGRQAITVEQVNMNEVVRSAVETLRHDLTKLGAEVTVEALPMVSADRMAMDQVVGNLLSNAVKYLWPGRPGRIRVWAEDAPEGTVVHFEDNGRGMAREDIPRAFELFRRVGRHDTPGEGMGLSYVQTLVRRHRGRIWCDSEADQGTTFHVFLPWFGAAVEARSK